MFAYCKNNPVSMQDNNGDRPDLGDGTGQETEQELEDSLSTMSKVNENILFYKERTKGTRPSTEEEHQKGQTRKQRDNRGEKGDARRMPNPNKRRTTNINWEPVAGIIIIVGVGIATTFIVADDATGVGVADDITLAPLGVIFWDGVKMVTG